MSTNPKQAKKSRWKGGLPIVLGFLGLGLLVGVLGYWGVTARIAGAIIASAKKAQIIRFMSLSLEAPGAERHAV